MNWDAIGAVSEMVGMVAVVISILYLGLQVKQSNRQSASEAGFTFVSELNHLQDLVLSVPDGASIIVKLKSATALTEEEVVVVEAYAARAMNAWYSAETSYRNGIMDRKMFNDVADDVKRHVQSYPGLSRYLQEYLSYYPGASETPLFAPVGEAASD